MHCNLFRKDNLFFFNAISAISDIIRIERDFIILFFRNTETISITFYRSKVTDCNDIVTLIIGAAEDHNILGIIIMNQPLESIPAVINFPHWRIFQIEVVKIPYKALQLAVAFIGEQLPIQFFFKVPFDKLSKFLSHEQKFLAWVRHHVTEHGAHTCKLLAIFSRHLIDERTLAVYNLIVGKRKHIVFRKSIHHAEGQFIMVIRTINRIKRYVIEHVVHPAHIPLKVKAQSSHIRRFGYQRPCRRFLSNHQDIGMFS